MSFEHEQFQRFLKKENNNNKQCLNNYSPTTEKRLYTKISTKKSPRIYQQRTIIEYRKNEEEKEEINFNKNNKNLVEYLFPSKAKKLAVIIVCMKMLLFCCWLVHEIASGFDEGQCLAVKNEENIILENKLENNLLKSTDNLQTIPINSDNSKMEQPKQGVKRRRKVILRRRLLRRGDRRSSSIVSKSIEDNNTTKNNSKQKRGNNPSSTMAVRRVIWKIVPLKKLPDNEENEEEDENLINLNNKKINPIKTKTARVVLKRIEEVENKEEEEEEENKLKQQRRMARRRTPNLLNNLKKNEETTKSSSTQQSSPIYSALSFPEQLETFLGLSKCYVRIIFDFWCLLECFCSALFLLALYLKFKCLAITSICVDVVSVVLAIIFGFSTLVFTLVLLLLPSNLPSKPILECFGLTTIIHIAIALFAWITCIEIKVAKNELKNKYDDEREEEKRINSCNRNFGDIPYSL